TDRRASRRLLHRAPGQMGRENRFRLPHRLDLEQPLAQAPGAGHAFRVPAEVLAELERGFARVALERERQARVLERHGEPFRGRGGRAWRSPGGEVTRLSKQPRVAERAPGDHDAGAVRVMPHGDYVGRGRDVTV